MKAYVFPGQGAQFVGMGKDLYDNNPAARELFEKANDILGFRITDLMFAGTDEDLRQTKVTQPAIFLHSTNNSKLESCSKLCITCTGKSIRIGEFRKCNSRLRANINIAKFISTDFQHLGVCGKRNQKN